MEAGEESDGDCKKLQCTKNVLTKLSAEHQETAGAASSTQSADRIPENAKRIDCSKSLYLSVCSKPLALGLL